MKKKLPSLWVPLTPLPWHSRTSTRQIQHSPDFTHPWIDHAKTWRQVNHLTTKIYPILRRLNWRLEYGRHYCSGHLGQTWSFIFCPHHRHCTPFKWCASCFQVDSHKTYHSSHSPSMEQKLAWGPMWKHHNQSFIYFGGNNLTVPEI